ncbi:hypothetical protein JAAARDRAFT_194434 [Jaapia argillacea MUCL 33604]|uniref:Ribosome production factor 2 homolog n=1 Tax=Jaapia argillacea MUCL 33604 TaxID=933084 RepID=A0A067PTW1_9AGAM|nr:hypothetical protein JAAARDRAFT_194434 [Jaapia argillacea MUCL 33604]
MSEFWKPKNARSKRALEAREAKEIEDTRTAIFIKGTHTGEVVNNVMKELMALKRPDAVSFSKKNAIRPFEDASSLEFFSQKNDASLFVIGQTTKKRPDGLVLVRMFDNKVLDMCELGVDKFVSMNEFKTPKSTPGHKPMLHFASDLFDTHPRFIHIKSLLISFFNGQVIDSIHLQGIEHVISISLSPTPASLDTTSTDLQSLPKVHLRTYTIKLTPSGTRTPHVTLVPMGPSLDLSLRRHTPPEENAHLYGLAMRKPKLKKQDLDKGLGKKKKNVEVDEMGDVRGRIHLGKQDLSGLRGKKMKGLREGMEDGDAEMESDGDVEMESDGDDDDEGEEADEEDQRKRQRR